MPQPDLVVGLGLRPDTDRAVILDALNEVLDIERIARLVTIDRRANDTGLRGVAEALTVSFHAVTVDELAAVPVPNPSQRIAAAVGIPSVAEACALLVGYGPLVVPKQTVGGVVVAASRAYAVTGFESG